MATKIKPTDENYVRMFYEHQYERMKTLEEQRLSITNYVITVSALAFTFGFKDVTQLTLLNAVGLPLIIVIVNWFAMAYIDRSARFIHTHRKRAKEVLHEFAPKLDDYNEKYA